LCKRGTFLFLKIPLKNKKRRRTKEMKKQKRNSSGITLIALVISIIIMLILAGVSINAIIGDNGVLTKAQTATFAQKIARYKEELEINIVGKADDMLPNRESVTMLKDSVKKYIPSLEDNDVGKFGIIAGQLYYLGNNELERQVCANQNFKMKGENQTVEEFVTIVENSALEAIVKDMAGDSFKVESNDGEEAELGVKLYDKNFANGDKWKIIIEVENGVTKAIYGTGWYYIEKGNNIENIGTLDNDYIINYETGKAVLFNASKHTMLAYGSNIAVKDNILYNADPTNMSDDDESSWGDAILHGFTETEYNPDGSIKSGWSETAFALDGENDYIELGGKANNVESVTIEFYGKFRSYTTNTATMFTKHSVASNYGINFSMYTSKFFENLSEELKLREDVWFGISGHRHFALNSDTVLNKDVYMALVFDPKDSEVYGRGRLYVDNVEIPMATKDMVWQEGDSRTPWEGSGYFDTEKCLSVFNEATPYIIGAGSTSGGNAMNEFSDCLIYSVRVYGRALSKDELSANYNATTSYHNILVNGGNAETSGETGGEDIDNIKN